MPCLCTNDTLRLFIRSVAQLDIAISTKACLSTPHRHKVTSRFAYERHLHTRCFVPGRSAALSRGSGYHENGYGNNVTLSKRHLITSSQQWQEDGAAQSEPPTSKGAVLELSLENIDALVAEMDRKASSIADKLADGPISGERFKRQSGRDKPAVGHIRRIQMKNTSVPIHYATPKAPLSTPSAQDARKRYKEPRQRVDEERKPPRETWQTQKEALKKKFPDGWMPQKRLSPDALAGIRALHAQEPTKYTTEALAESFEVSPEAIRRILRSKWLPDAEEESDRARRWLKRGEEVWSRRAELGVKPPRMWRDMGIGSRKPEWKKKPAQQVMPPLITTSRRSGPANAAGG